MFLRHMMNVSKPNRPAETMSVTETLTVHGRGRHAEPRAYPGWLLRVFPEPNQSRIVLRAIAISALILGAEYLVEVVWLDLPYWQQWEFLAEPGVQLSALGLVFTLVLLGQWGARYVELWDEVRPAFETPAEDEAGERDERDERRGNAEGEYDAVVGRNLLALYGRDHVPFLLFAGVQAVVYGLFRSELPAGFLHVGFLHFFAVAALYCFYRHVVTIREVTELDLVDVAGARPVLSEVADFGVVVGLNWFAALSLLVAYVGFFVGLERGIGLFYALAVFVLVAVGLLIFVVPLVLLHEALAAAKHERLRRIGDDYEDLYEAWRENEVEGDPSVGLDILEKRRRNVEALSTWPYRLASLGQLALGSLVPTLLSVVQTFGLGG